MDHPSHHGTNGDKQTKGNGPDSNSKRPSMSESTRAATFLMRRRSSGNGSPKPVRSNTPEMRAHLKYLGPSNAASRPKSTRINTVKIKPGVHTIPENTAPHAQTAVARSASFNSSTAPQGGLGEGLLAPNHQASDGVQALHQGYGTMLRHNTAPDDYWKKSDNTDADGGNVEVSTQVPQKDDDDPQNPDDTPASPKAQLDKIIIENRPPSLRSSGSHSTISSLPEEQRTTRRKTTARSGSITENTIHVNGVKKLVLDISSGSDGDDGLNANADAGQSNGVKYADGKQIENDNNDSNSSGSSQGKKKRKKRAGKKKGRQGEESTPLLGDRD